MGGNQKKKQSKLVTKLPKTMIKKIWDDFVPTVATEIPEEKIQ